MTPQGKSRHNPIIGSLPAGFEDYKQLVTIHRNAGPNTRVTIGEVKEISIREVVPGDILTLEAGNIVPADVRWMENVNLRI